MKKILIAAICVVWISSAAVAQDFPRVEIFGGYSLTKLGGQANDLYDEWELIGEGSDADSFSTSKWFEKGFNASATFNLHKHFGVEASFGYNSGQMAEFSFSDGDTMQATGKQNGNYFTFMVGPRFAYRHEAFTPFAHLLLGMGRIGMDYSAACTEDGSDCNSEFIDEVQIETDGLLFIDDSHTGFAFTAGGGLDVNVNDSFAIRVIQVDYVQSRHGGFLDVYLGNLNLSFGAVVRLGN